MKIWNGHKQPGDSGIYPVCCAMLGTPSDWVCFMQRADDTRAHLRAVVPQRQASIGSTTGYITLHRGVDRCAKDPVHACMYTCTSSSTGRRHSKLAGETIVPCLAKASIFLHSMKQLQRNKHSATAPCLSIMSVLLETSLGDITIDLLVDEAPKCCEK